MKYLKTYEAIIKADRAEYVNIEGEMFKIIEDCLRDLEIYSKKELQSIIDDSFDNIEMIWTDLKDDLESSLSVSFERTNTHDVAGKNLNGVMTNRLLVLLQGRKDLNSEEIDSVINTNKNCESISNIESTINGRDPKYYGISKYSTVSYNYEIDFPLNFWQFWYNNGPKTLSVNLYHVKYGPKVLPIVWEKTLEYRSKIDQCIRPKLRGLGYAPIISYGGSVGASGKKDTIDIKIIKLKNETSE